MGIAECAQKHLTPPQVNQDHGTGLEVGLVIVTLGDLGLIGRLLGSLRSRGRWGIASLLNRKNKANMEKGAEKSDSE